VLKESRDNGYRALDSLARRVRLPKRALVILAEADSFQSLLQDRREILWAVRRLPDDDALPLFAARFFEEQLEEEIAPLPPCRSANMYSPITACCACRYAPI
jgi:error-prone DNA polymerase